MSKSFLFCFIAFASLTLNAKILYVSPTGTDNTVSAQYKTLTYASTLTLPGDTVWVKSGTYNEKVVISKSGILGNPISFIGYKVIPGDRPTIIANKKDPYSAFTDTSMPLFDGLDRTKGTGFNFDNQQYITVKNFQIRNYAYGFSCGGFPLSKGNLNINNVSIMNCGDPNASYSGLGFIAGSMSTKFSDNNIFTNCLVVNACAEAFSINGDNNTLTNCKAYCNENTTQYASTDYYILICGSHNNINNCYIERLAGIKHAGHGMGVKSNAVQIIDQGKAFTPINPQYNTFKNCEAKNMGESFYARHRGSQFNSFIQCKATGTHTGIANSDGGEGNAFVTRDGASNNTFSSCIAMNCNSGIEFLDTEEDGDSGPNPLGHPGSGNRFIGCLIYNCYIGVNFSEYSIQSDAGANTVQKCTFYKTRYMHFAARHCANMTYVHNIYYGCLPNKTGGYLAGNKYVSDITPSQFTRCDFYDIEGGTPISYLATDETNIAQDPMFTDPVNMDFTLKSESPCNVTGANIIVK